MTAPQSNVERLAGRLDLILCFASFAVLVMLVLEVCGVDFTARDATDPPNGRSGLELLTDHGTGCQYLRRYGDLTPRLGVDGKQICGGAK